MNFVSVSTFAFLAVAAVVGAVIAIVTWRNSASPDTVAQILHTAESAAPRTKAPAMPTTK